MQKVFYPHNSTFDRFIPNFLVTFPPCHSFYIIMKIIMNGYLDVLKIAILTFPFVAFLISLPFILIQYHKYGSISSWKVIVLYSFVLYLTCAYFLVILPLPSLDEVAHLTTPRTQFIPFQFIGEFITHTSFKLFDPQTYLTALSESYFFVPIYNILLTLPFGVYIRYYFRYSFKKTVLLTFLLSLFFELTQLSGLYFIYPRGYRLFDVDDLILNTSGGMLGYLLAAPLLKILPDRAKIDADTREKGKVVSGFRRTTAFGLDLALYSLLTIPVNICLGWLGNTIFIFVATLILYFFIIPATFNGATLGEKFLKLKISSQSEATNLWQISWRRILFVILYIAIPRLAIFFITILPLGETNTETIALISLAVLFIFYGFTALKFLFTNKPILYEKLSHTKFSSTIN